MAGRLTLMVYPNGASPDPPYRLVTPIQVVVREGVGGRQVHQVSLAPGDVLVMEPGVVHCAANVDEAPCHFMCIEGIGTYDFIEVAANPTDGTSNGEKTEIVAMVDESAQTGKPVNRSP